MYIIKTQKFGEFGEFMEPDGMNGFKFARTKEPCASLACGGWRRFVRRQAPQACAALGSGATGLVGAALSRGSHTFWDYDQKVCDV